MTLTTLQMARAIAEAVCANDLSDFDDLPDKDHPPTQAVLATLREHGSWFCRIREDEKAGTVDTPYEDVQMDLFR